MRGVRAKALRRIAMAAPVHPQWKRKLYQRLKYLWTRRLMAR